MYSCGFVAETPLNEDSILEFPSQPHLFINSILTGSKGKEIAFK